MFIVFCVVFVWWFLTIIIIMIFINIFCIKAFSFFLVNIKEGFDQSCVRWIFYSISRLIVSVRQLSVNLLSQSFVDWLFCLSLVGWLFWSIIGRLIISVNQWSFDCFGALCVCWLFWSIFGQLIILSVFCQWIICQSSVGWLFWSIICRSIFFKLKKNEIL